MRARDAGGVVVALAILGAAAWWAMRAQVTDDVAPVGGAPALGVRLATYNVWAVPFVSAEREGRLARLPAALRALAPDVLCLQEVWTAPDRARIRADLAAALPHAAEGGGGLLVLSRFPVSASRFVAFPADDTLSLVERMAGKGLLDVVLETPVGPLRVVTTHLAAEFGPDGARMRQLAFLLRHLDALRTDPVILAGDLNTSATAGETLGAGYRMLLDGGLLDVAPPVQGSEGGWVLREKPTRVGWPRSDAKSARGWRPDHVLFRSAATARLESASHGLALDAPDTALSDHNLLLADFLLRAQPPGRGR